MNASTAGVVLDTHVVLWWQADGRRLSRRARRVVEEASLLHLSPVSLWEIATLVRLGRVELDREPISWVRDLLRDQRIEVARLTPEAAAWAGLLPETFVGDPIDRLVYATARDLRLPLVTKDDRIHAYGRQNHDVEVVW